MGLFDGITNAISSAFSSPSSLITSPLTPISVPIAVAKATTNVVSGAGNAISNALSGAASSFSATPFSTSSAFSKGDTTTTFNQEGYRVNNGLTITDLNTNKIIVNQGEVTGDITWVNAQTGAYASGNKAISTSHYLDVEDRTRTINKYLSKGWISESDADKAIAELRRVDSGTNVQYYASSQTPVSTVQTSAARTAEPLKKLETVSIVSASNPVSGGIDAVINARDDMIFGGIDSIAAGNVLSAKTAKGAAALTTDVLLPLDLTNVVNLYATGRGSDVTWDMLAVAGIDALALATIPFTAGAGYVGIKGLKTAAKGVKYGSYAGQAGLTGVVGASVLAG